MTVDIIERSEGHYEVQDVEFGRVYRWRPERVVVECDCGERSAVTPSISTCWRCGSDLDELVLDEPLVRRLKDRRLHPWRYARDPEGTDLPL